MGADDLESRVAETRELVSMLRDRGDDVEVPRRVTFELVVPGPPLPVGAVDELRRASFTVLPVPTRWWGRLLGRGRTRLRLERVTAVDERTAESFTRELVTWTLRHGGRFEMWLPDPVGQDGPGA